MREREREGQRVAARGGGWWLQWRLEAAVEVAEMVLLLLLLKPKMRERLERGGGGNERRKIRVRLLLHLTLLSSVLWTRFQNDFGLTIGY